MSRPPLADPPSVAELAELVTRVATTTPAAVPSLLWLIVRSSATVRMLRAIEPTGAYLVTIADEPAGRALVASSQAGAARLARWTAAAAALDDVLPIPPPEPQAGDED